MSEPEGWAGILDADEEIIWQGRPDDQISFTAANIATSLFGMAFAGFALFWMIMASTAGGFFWMFGLIHFSVGVGLVFGPHVYGAYRRKHTWYTLSNKRAFIATALPLLSRRLKSYPINQSSVLNFQQGPLATLHFDHEMRRTKNGHRRVNIGFERIKGGDEVYRLMREIQKEAAQ